MPFEFDWTSWLAGVVTLANVVAVIVVMIHGMYMRRVEGKRRKRTRSR